MHFMISNDRFIQNHRKKGTKMTTNIIAFQKDIESTELFRARREKRRERRRRQIDAFFRSVNDQSADKMIFLFNQDMNIA